MTHIEHSHEYFLTAAQCNAQQELPLASLERQIIDVATEHAAIIGVGAVRLAEDDNTWVLSRIAIEMKRYPRMHSRYTITTWVESFAKFFSERNFVISDENDQPIGYARTVWVCINRTTRHPSDISALAAAAPKDPERECPIAPVGKLRKVTERGMDRKYTFKVCDIDFNRHVNSVVYTELIVDQLDMATLDKNFIRRFDINFHQEAHFDDTITVSSSMTDEGVLSGMIADDETTYVLGRITLSPRIDLPDCTCVKD